MKKSLILSMSLFAFSLLSQQSFKLVSPKPQSLVYYRIGDSILVEIEASGFDSTKTFNLDINGITEATIKYSDFKDGRYSAKVPIFGYILEHNQIYFAYIRGNQFAVMKQYPIVGIYDDVEDKLQKEYKYYDVLGRESPKHGFVIRSDGQKIIFK